MYQRILQTHNFDNNTTRSCNFPLLSYGHTKSVSVDIKNYSNRTSISILIDSIHPKINNSNDVYDMYKP